MFYSRSYYRLKISKDCFIERFKGPDVYPAPLVSCNLSLFPSLAELSSPSNPVTVLLFSKEQTAHALK
jgi:hypothetical protein